jgi:hypothetical protein
MSTPKDKYSCPYCKATLSQPTRKKACPHCGKIIYCRTRPNEDPAWVKEEDLQLIAAEWSKNLLEKSQTDNQIIHQNWLYIARNNIRVWVKTGVVSLKLYTAEDAEICKECQKWRDKIFFIRTPEEIRLVMDNAKIKNCTNPNGCRCYWRPADVGSIK